MNGGLCFIMGFLSPHFLTWLWALLSLREEHRFNTVQETWRLRLSRQEGHHLAFPMISSSKPDARLIAKVQQVFPFWGLTTVFWSLITVWYYTLGAYWESKVHHINICSYWRSRTRKLKGSAFRLFSNSSVWLHYLKNKINKNLGD